MAAVNPMPVPGSGRQSPAIWDANGDRVERRAPVSRNDGAGTPPVEAFAPEREDRHVEHADDERRDESRKGMLRRHLFAFLAARSRPMVGVPTPFIDSVLGLARLKATSLGLLDKAA